MSPETALEEAVAEDLTRDHVERRVEDWRRRVEQLYRNIESWLPEGWSARRGPPYSMRANLLEKFHLGRCELPTLQLLRAGQVIVEIYPLVLWILGANGRLSAYKGTEIFHIADYARLFEPPIWRITPAHDVSRRKALDRDAVWELLAI